jgi:intermembrane space import and assembly protein 40
VFLTEEDLAKPETLGSLVAEEDEEFGVILPNGEINWECPCLGGMPQGPCGQEFKDAFSCFHYSTAEEKGSDCIDKFRAMQECFQKYPDLYKDYEEDGEEMTKTEEEGKGEMMDPEGEVKGSEQSSGADGGSRVLTSSSAPGS